jgi:thermostable 8-oxoguanine DNA glycosylase
MNFGVSPIAGLLDRLHKRLINLKELMAQYQQQPSQIVYIEIKELLKTLAEQENLDVRLP